jgi:hypothetical protein
LDLSNTLIDLTVDECFTIETVPAEDELGNILYEPVPEDADESYVPADHPIYTTRLVSALSPLFDPDTVPENRTFAAEVPFLGYPARIHALPSNPEAEVKIELTGADLGSQAGTATYKITVKPQVLKYFTEAQLGELDPPILASTTEYMLNLTRKPGSSNAKLSLLSITGGTIPFDAEVLTYDGADHSGVLVPASTTRVTISAEAEDTNAMVQISASGDSTIAYTPADSDAGVSATLSGNLIRDVDNALVFTVLVTPQNRAAPARNYEVKIKRDLTTRVENASGGNLSFYTDPVTHKIYETHTFIVDNTTPSAGTKVFSGNDALKFVESKRPATVDVLVVAGGGGAGYSTGNLPSGGGGAGGLIYKTGYAINKNSYDITVGNGGNPAASSGSGANGALRGENGGSSLFGESGSTARLEAPGGGGGASHNGSTYNTGGSGGSGGGASAYASSGGNVSKFFFDGSLKPADGLIAFGNKGGGKSGGHGYNAHGGGGAASSGGTAPEYMGANGGMGKKISISGTPIWYAAGGAGSGNSTYNTLEGYGANQGNAGTPNTGGGGSGATISGNGGPGGAGGSGTVIVRWEWVQ